MSRYCCANVKFSTGSIRLSPPESPGSRWIHLPNKSPLKPNNRVLLREMTYVDKASYESLPPFTNYRALFQGLDGSIYQKTATEFKMYNKSVVIRNWCPERVNNENEFQRFCNRSHHQIHEHPLRSE